MGASILHNSLRYFVTVPQGCLETTALHLPSSSATTHLLSKQMSLSPVKSQYVLVSHVFKYNLANINTSDHMVAFSDCYCRWTLSLKQSRTSEALLLFPPHTLNWFSVTGLKYWGAIRMCPGLLSKCSREVTDTLERYHVPLPHVLLLKKGWLGEKAHCTVKTKCSSFLTSFQKCC